MKFQFKLIIKILNFNKKNTFELKNKYKSLY
jgi:hypothetical protein